MARNLYTDRKRYGVNPDGTIRTRAQYFSHMRELRGKTEQDELNELVADLEKLLTLNLQIGVRNVR